MDGWMGGWVDGWIGGSVVSDWVDGWIVDQSCCLEIIAFTRKIRQFDSCSSSRGDSHTCRSHIHSISPGHPAM